MSANTPNAIHLSDYTPPDFLIENVHLRFDLDEEQTTVESRLDVRRNDANGPHRRPLVLNGADIELESLAIDGVPVSARHHEQALESLTVEKVPDRFTLEVRTHLRPQQNTSLEGLYLSAHTFCTQCEAEGFRKITYYPDRPDVMARFSTTIVADRDRYPVLLSNGNLKDHGELEGNRHWVTWEDPYPKPSYLFALVAGNLACLEGRYRTGSGREVKLQIFTEHHNLPKCEHAMQSLQKAMKWDEDVYGLEYDLDIYMIVAVDHFNMGAMENKGLNVFNSKYVLADPQSATDEDYAAVEGVIAHEYFHNWTGNRVTLRDWFQLSLKEGLTVFRDQQFSSDTFLGAVNRIQNVRLLRNNQFPEDAGPMAHPVRPTSYIEINNFYTATVYEKGAEVIRMIHTLLGPDRFLAGMRLYIERHDGEAATTDDFIRAMQDASGVNLEQFERWYEQAGTPTLEVRGEYDPSARVYELEVSQSCPPSPGQPRKAPFHIPLAVALLDREGRELTLRLEGEGEARAARARVLDVKDAHNTFRFENLSEPPVPSVLRDFSAPVHLEVAYRPGELEFLAARDPNPFNRWNAGQELATEVILRLIDDFRAGCELRLDPGLAAAMQSTLRDRELDHALIAEALVLPTETYLAERMGTVDVEAIHEVREFVRRALARHLREDLVSTYHAGTSNESYRFEPRSCARRKLRNVCLAYMMELGEETVIRQCLQQLRQSDNMTEVLGALVPLANIDAPERRTALQEFTDRFGNDPLVLDKWFTTQATSRLPGTLTEVKALMRHPAFNIKNPNKVRALVGAFCYGNAVRFHAASGDGYRFLAERVAEIDPLNPKIAARLLNALGRWRKFDSRRQALMRGELERILELPRLSRDTYEIASKTLA